MDLGPALALMTLTTPWFDTGLLSVSTCCETRLDIVMPVQLEKTEELFRLSLASGSFACWHDLAAASVCVTGLPSLA